MCISNFEHFKFAYQEKINSAIECDRCGKNLQGSTGYIYRGYLSDPEDNYDATFGSTCHRVIEKFLTDKENA